MISEAKEKEIIMHKYQRAQYIPVNPGDLVTLQTGRLDYRGESVTATVVEVNRRLGLINNGRTECAPLLRVKVQCSNKLEYIDNGYVKAVVRAKKGRRIPAPVNYYRERTLIEVKANNKANTWYGSAYDLVANALALMPFKIERPLHPERFLAMFMADLPGVVSIGRNGYTYTVKKFKLRRWVSQNWSKLLFTTAELRKEETARNRQFEDDMLADIEYFEERANQHNEMRGWEEDSY